MLTPAEVEEFKKITQEVKGVNLTDDQALDQGIRLVILFDLMNKKEHSTANQQLHPAEPKSKNNSR